MEGKKKNIFIGILGTTTVIAAGVAVYFGLKYNSSRIENAKLQEIANEPKQTEVVEKEKIVTEYAIPQINPENCLNSKNGFKYQKNLYQYSTSYATWVYGESDSKKLDISIDKAELEKNLPDLVLNNANEYGEFYHSHLFDNEVRQIYIGGLGQTEWAEAIIFCVLDDGSVYCLNIIEAIKSGDFDSFVKLDEVSDIIEVGKLNVSPGVTGWFSVYAARKDGKFYDLEDILKNKGLTL